MIGKSTGTFPDAIRELDLSLPTWIEASAGTGKTYAIERIVLRLTAEKGFKPGEILLLSFTRKTAEELRERIRAKLKKESDPKTAKDEWTSAQRKRIGDAYLLCDEAAVHTLHGFCQTALLTHALEMRLPFGSELREERESIGEALESLLLGSWSRDPGFLHALQKACGENLEAWRRHLTGIAMAFNPERGDKLHIRPDPNWLGNLAEEIVPTALELEKALAGWGQSQQKGENDVFSRLRDLALKLASLSDVEKAQTVGEFFVGLSGNTKAVKNGFAAVIPESAAGDAKWARLAKSCDAWRARRDTLRERKKAHAAAMDRVPDNETLARAAREIRAQMAKEKRRLGVLSYDDMISKLAVAVRKNPGLAARIGAGFKACIVDEFQDTDPLQWELLRHLCLEGARRIPLFLVGDPKQAIYGFRGGDPGTYLGARREFHKLAGAGKAQGFGLEVNWRSSPRLIAALNAVFPHPSWFGPTPAIETDPGWQLPGESPSIVFAPAKAPPNADAPKPDAPIILRDFVPATGLPVSKPETEKAMRRWITSRIRSLAPDHDFRGMAVLTRTNPEAEAVEKHLRREGIPCRLRRRGGMFAGPHADALRLLLDLLEKVSDPNAQARILLLPFLRGASAEAPEIPEECPALIRKWAQLAEAGRWPGFFDSVLYESGYAYRLAVETGQDSGFQTLTALARILAAEGMKHGCSLRALRDRFDALSEEDGTNENTTGTGGVSVMTLHMSKGLEFPVVFLAALTDGVKSKTHLTLRDENVFLHALDPKDPEMVIRYTRQSREENRRLFYVGLTRAKHNLFIPLLPKNFSQSKFGPLGDFAGLALRQAAAEYPELFRFDIENDETSSALVGAATRAAPTREKWPDRDPRAETWAHLWEKRRGLASYSQLVQHALPPLEEDGQRLDRDEGGDREIEALPSALPGGAATGTALHSLLETLDFAAAGRAADPTAFLEMPGIREAIGRQISRYALPEGCAAEIASLLWHSLRMSIPDPAAEGQPVFRLAEIAERRSEVEFLLRTSNGFLWGFIDLVFRQGGRYYLLDWKSNRLDRYDQNAIDASMREHRYDLQYQLYSVALDKWLQARLPDYDPREHFGGVIYLYLRGAPNAVVSDGFSGFAHRPSPRELREEYPRRLREIMGLS